MDAIATIAALKADAATANVQTIAFASHVHTELDCRGGTAGADVAAAIGVRGRPPIFPAAPSPRPSTRLPTFVTPRGSSIALRTPVRRSTGCRMPPASVHSSSKSSSYQLVHIRGASNAAPAFASVFTFTIRRDCDGLCGQPRPGTGPCRARLDLPLTVFIAPTPRAPRSTASVLLASSARVPGSTPRSVVGKSADSTSRPTRTSM